MNMRLLRCFFLLLASTGLIITTGKAQTNDESAPTNSAATNRPAASPPILSHVASLSTDDLKEYADQPEAVQRLIAQGLALTHLNLSYKYGSSDPKNGGMDCSGTIYYLLNQAGLQDVPRDSGELYQWVWKQSRFQSVISTSANTFELSRLKPGDLLFWTGTYHVDRDPPITHVMIYLGTNRQTQRRVMLGASEGRTYNGKSMYGVSVFDFKMPAVKVLPVTAAAKPELESRFVGYGSIPGLNEASATDSPKN